MNKSSLPLARTLGLRAIRAAATTTSACAASGCAQRSTANGACLDAVAQFWAAVRDMSDSRQVLERMPA